MKRCRVSYTDREGVEHAVELDAGSLYEAIGLAIHRSRRSDHVNCERSAIQKFTIEPQETATQHRLPRRVFDEWLRRPPRSPAEMLLKTRLRALLCDSL